jgi:integrase
MNKKKLNKTVVDSIKPGALEQWVWDADLPGFGVRCTPAGRKTYVVRYRAADGTQRKQVVARCCDMPPDKARDLARKVFAEVAGGADPMAQRRPEPVKALPTVTAMFTAYVANMRSKNRASASEVERALLTAKNCAAAALGPQKPAQSVTATEVVNYVAKLYNEGHRGAADKHRSYIASAYTWAMKSANDYTVAERQDWGLTFNPASDVPKDSGAVKTRDRNLSAAELKALWQATRIGSAGFAPETAACIRLLIGLGQRVQETLRMDGAEIDFKEAVWRMPAHKTKGRKLAHVVPLPSQVLPDLKLLVALHGDGPLFKGKGNEAMPYQTINQAIGRWQEANAEQVAHFQTRDLRRTWKSRAHDAGVDRFTRDLIQQHAKNDTGSKNYDRAEYLPQMREAMAKWAGWIDANLEDAPALKLVA